MNNEQSEEKNQRIINNRDPIIQLPPPKKLHNSSKIGRKTVRLVNDLKKAHLRS